MMSSLTSLTGSELSDRRENLHLELDDLHAPVRRENLHLELLLFLFHVSSLVVQNLNLYRLVSLIGFLSDTIFSQMKEFHFGGSIVL